MRSSTGSRVREDRPNFRRTSFTDLYWLLTPLLEALGKFCGTHENYEKTLMEALEKIELTERRAEKLIYSLARSDKSDERKRKSILSISDYQ